VTQRVLVSSIDQVPGFMAARTLFDLEFDLLGAQFRTSTLWWIVIALIATWILQRTRYGNWIFAVGGDAKHRAQRRRAAARVKIMLFMMTSAAGLAGGHDEHRAFAFGGGQRRDRPEFVYIIAVVTGGCLLTGGYGSVIGACIGALIFGMARVGIVFAGWDTDWFYSFLGIMLLVAVLVNDYSRRRAEAVSIAAAEIPVEVAGAP